MHFITALKIDHIGVLVQIVCSNIYIPNTVSCKDYIVSKYLPESPLKATASSSAPLEAEGDGNMCISVLPQSSCAHLVRGTVWTAIDVSAPASKILYNYGLLWPKLIVRSLACHC